jgi:hypothetical protein
MAISPTLLTALISTAGVANDTAIGGSGAGVYPIETSEVRLVRELVVFQEVSDSFSVTADLHFRNDTDQPLTLRLGFPARTKVEGDGDPEVHDLAVWVDGEPVTAHRVALSQEESVDIPWEEIFIFEAPFPARAEVQILHTYSLTTGGDSMGGRLTQYIFQTGAGWAGTIDQARFVFRFERPPMGLQMHYAGERLPPLGTPPVPGKPTQSYVAGPTPSYELLFENVEPTGDLWLYWDGQPWFELVASTAPEGREYDCIYPLRQWYRGLLGAPWASSPLPDQELLACFDADWLRNLIFAARGYPFSKPAWQQAFGGRFPPSGLPYEDSWLNAQERLAVEALAGLD